MVLLIVVVVVECELYCMSLDEKPNHLSTGKKKYAEDSDSNESTMNEQPPPSKKVCKDKK